MLILQILCFVVGIYALTQSRIKLSQTRVLQEQETKVVGAVLVGGGVLSLFFGGLVALVTLMIAVGYAFTQTQG